VILSNFSRCDCKEINELHDVAVASPPSDERFDGHEEAYSALPGAFV